MDDINLEKYYKEIAFENQYKDAAGFLRNKIHMKMEKPFSKNMHFENVLELGALFGNHRKFVKHSYDTYSETDLFIKEKEIFKSENSDVKRFKLDATELVDIEDASVDRLIATCLIIHLEKPEKVLKIWKRVVKSGGYLSLWVQCEPSILLNLSRKFYSSKRQKDFYNLLYKEHINYYLRTEFLVKQIFKDDELEISKFPFNKLNWNLNLASIFTIKIS